ncbi:MAG: LysE family transporter [Rhodoluna sp.]|nr:LysE family transporter [Rhodoluna sp.]
MWELFTIGFLAGLALAIPVGPMAILLVNTTISRGLRHGVVGALGMATVDGVYALAVFVIGGIIASALASLELVFGLVGAAILLFLGVQTLIKNLLLLGKTDLPANVATEKSSVAKTFGTFVAATVVNPPTALYFLAIAPNVANMGFELSFSTATIFALAVLIGSLIWQESLVFVGLAVRGITSNRFRVWLGLLGGLLIIGLALSIGYRAIWS